MRCTITLLSVLTLLSTANGQTRDDPWTPAAFAIGQNGHTYVSMALGSHSTYIDEVRPRTPKHFTIRNSTNGKIVVCLYRGTDRSRAVPFKRFPMPKGSTAGYSPQVVHVKVFKPAIIDKLVATKLTVTGNITVKGSRNKPSVHAAKPTPVTLQNRGKERLKFCIYNKGDLVQAIPKFAVTLEPGYETTWNTNDRQYRLKVFRPRLLDKPLANRICHAQSKIAVRQSDLTRWNRINRSAAPVVGPITIQRSPFASGHADIRRFLIAGIDGQGTPYTLEVHWNSSRNRVSAASKWEKATSLFGTERLDVAPSIDFDGRRSAGGKTGTDAITYVVRKGTVYRRRVFKEGALAHGRNDGPWEKLAIESGSPLLISGSGRAPVFVTRRANGHLEFTRTEGKKGKLRSPTLLGGSVIATPAVTTTYDKNETVWLTVHAVRKDGVIRARRINWKHKQIWENETTWTGNDWVECATLNWYQRKYLRSFGPVQTTNWMIARNRKGYIWSAKRKPGRSWSKWELFSKIQFRAGPATITLN